MPEEARSPFEAWEFPPNFGPIFTNAHIMAHNRREFFLTFGVAHPPHPKLRPVVQVVMTKEHVMELILNLQMQLKKFNEEQGSSQR